MSNPAEKRPSSARPWLVLPGLLAGAAAALSVGGVDAALAQTPARTSAPVAASLGPIVDTSSGRIQGRPADAEGVLSFLGVRYAEPPIGALRFMPPVLAFARPGVTPATEFGAISAQIDDEGGTVASNGQSEDSLSLNIWTPALTGKRPVMVWIHGGGNWQGSSKSADGADLVKTGDVVVVSINYRLGVFGFLDVSSVAGPQYQPSVNNGLRDQLMALEWVKRNIARFGGDPDNVTVFGNSAGGTNISALLATEAPERSFRRAILQSGFAGSTKSRKHAADFAASFFAKGGIRTREELMAKSADELIAIEKATLADLREIERDGSFQPTADGVLVPDFSQRRLEAGSARSIDLLLGYTKNELRFYPLLDPAMGKLKAAEMPVLRDLPKAKQDELVALYGKSRPGDTETELALDIAGDLVFRMPAVRMAEAQLRYNPDVYLYSFDWVAADPKLGAPHAIEHSFVWGFKPGAGARAAAPNDTARRAQAERLSDLVQQYWTSFARSGTPQAKSGAWPRYTAERRETMVFNAEARVVADPAAEERKAYDGMTFDRQRPGER
ncbi:carboxylesterase/lipase family protein [Phenylobacterium sp.]|jgi:para-nitrobenzyl esterase|uniref:carboxylesterase/lipase family protein n=1 Tax=Phenylobacterium sp. TaxID=1871053 RepID=UPI0037830EB3